MDSASFVREVRTCRAGVIALEAEAEQRFRMDMPRGPIWLRRAAERLAAVTPPWNELTWAPSEHRAYRLLARSAWLEAWVIYWPQGGNLELHDHGGASGAFAVVHGELSETFTTIGGAALKQRQVKTDDAVSFGITHVHHVVNNEQAGATSVHVYSQPLVAMNFYRVGADGRVVPVRVGQGDEPSDAVALSELPMRSDGWIDLAPWTASPAHQLS